MSASLVNNSHVSGVKESNASSILGTDWNSKNFAYVVIVILSQVGMNQTQNTIQDQGQYQRMIAKGQTSFANMQQFMSLLEANTQWNGTNAYWPPNFTSAHSTEMSNFINSFGQFFSNNSSDASSNDDSSTGKSLEVTMTLTSSLTINGHTYGKGTIITFNPAAGNVQVQTAGSTTVIPGGGDFSSYLKQITDYYQSVTQYVTGSQITLPCSDGDSTLIPQYLAAASAQLQTQIDSEPETAYTDCFVNGSIGSFVGTPDSNPILSQAASLYSEFTSTTGTGGESMATDMINAYNTGSSSDVAQVWSDFDGAMALWMQNKMSDQSNASGVPAPSGAIILSPSNSMDSAFVTHVSGVVTEYLEGYGKLIAQLNPYNGGKEAEAYQSAVDAYNSLINAETVGGSAAMTDVNNAIASLQNVIECLLPGGKWSSVINTLAQPALNALTAIQNSLQPPTVMTETGFYDSTSSAISMGLSTYQAQTQQNSASLQQDSSTLTSYDQIGQQIVSSLNKMLQVMTSNLKS